MLFVFGGLALLWLAMAVLVRLTPDPLIPVAPEAAPDPAASAVKQRAAAAAVAVALALTSDRGGPVHPTGFAPPLSAWQAARRVHGLQQRGRRS